MKKSLVGIVMFLASAFAFAQSPVTVTGTMTDAGNNIATGTVEFDIQPASSSIHYYVQGVATLVSTSTTCNIVNGALQNSTGGACVVWGNDVISPANTTYTVTIFDNGQQTQSIPHELITGTTYSLNAPVFGPIVRIIPQYNTITTPQIQTNLLPAISHVFSLGNAQSHYANAYIDNLFLGPSGTAVAPAPPTSQSFLGSNSFAQFIAAPYTPVNKAGDTMSGALTTPILQGIYLAGSSAYPTVASAVSAAETAGGGMVETPPNYTETLASLTVGAAGAPVQLLLGAGTVLTVNGGNGSSGVQIYGQSFIGCRGTANSCTIKSAQTGSPLQLITDTPQDETNLGFSLAGVLVDCGSSVPYTNGCIYINNVFAPSYLRDVYVERFANPSNVVVGLHITSTLGTAGGTNVLNLDNVTVNGSGNLNAQPVLIDRSGTGSVSAVTFSHGTLENPGAASAGGYLHDVVVNGAGSNYQMYNIAFQGTQLQGNASSSVSTLYAKDVQNLRIDNMPINGQGTGPAVELDHTGSGDLGSVLITALYSGYIKNDVSGNSTPSSATMAGGYIYPGENTPTTNPPYTIDGPMTVYGTFTSNGVTYIGDVHFGAGNSIYMQGGNFYLDNSNKTRISGDTSGNLALNYNTGATGSVCFYGGTTTTVFCVSNTGAGTMSSLTLSGGSNAVSRCTTAGALPVGALTVTPADCGASAATSLTVN